MKFIQTVVAAEGFRDASSNGRRLALLEELVGRCARENARLLLLPAGFLTAQAEDGLQAWIERLDQQASAAGIGVVGGIDVIGPAVKRSPSLDDIVRTGRLPFFGFAAGRVTRPSQGHRFWRQTSIDNGNAELVPADAVPGAERLVHVDERCVGVLICGELFSWRARQGIGRAGADLIVDVGHAGMGQGLIPAMRAVAEEGGCPVAHSQHLQGWYGRSLHFVDGDGEQRSLGITEDHIAQREGLWAAWAARSV